MKKKLIVYFYLMISIIVFSQTDTVTLFYDIGVFKLNKENYSKISNYLETVNDSTNYKVEIVSSADFLGSKLSNQLLSENRAKTIKKLLDLKENVKIDTVSQLGLGELKPTLNKTNEGIPEHRKSYVIFKDKTTYLLDKIKDAKKGDVFILTDITFEPGSHMLQSRSIPIIRRLLEVLKENSNLKIELRGHVCCGKERARHLDGYDLDTKKYDLSSNRAKHLYKYLTLKGIAENRITHKGYAFKKPLYFPEINEFQKEKNRRVEVKIVSNEN